MTLITYQAGWFVVLVFFVLLVAHSLGRRTHWSLAMALIWSIAPGLVLVATSSVTLGAFGLSPSHVQAGSMATLVLFMGAMERLARSRASVLCLSHALTVMSVLSAVTSLAERALGVSPGGLVGDTSINAAFMAMTAPAIVSGPFPWAAAFPTIAVILNDSTTATVVLCLTLPLALKSNARRKLALTSLLLIAAIGYIGSGFFFDGGRFALWREIAGAASPLLGSGPFALAMRNFHGPAGILWTHPHSEILRLYYEQGIVGTVLWAIPVTIAALPLWRNEALRGSALATLLLFAVQCSGYYALTATWGATLLILGLIDRKPNDQGATCYRAQK